MFYPIPISPQEKTPDSINQSLFNEVALALVEGVEKLRAPQETLNAAINAQQKEIETLKQKIPDYEEQTRAEYTEVRYVICLCQSSRDCDTCKGYGKEKVTFTHPHEERRAQAKKALTQLKNKISHIENNIKKLEKEFCDSKDPYVVYVREKNKLFDESHCFYQYQSPYHFLIESLKNPAIREEQWFFNELIEVMLLLNKQDKDKNLLLISDMLHHFSTENFLTKISLCSTGLLVEEKKIILANLCVMISNNKTTEEIEALDGFRIMYAAGKFSLSDTKEVFKTYQSIFGVEIDQSAINELEQVIIRCEAMDVIRALKTVLASDGYFENKKELFYNCLYKKISSDEKNPPVFSDDERFSYQEYLDDCKLANEINKRLDKKGETPSFKPFLLVPTEFQEFYAYHQHGNADHALPFLVPIYLTRNELDVCNKDKTQWKNIVTAKNAFYQWSDDKKARFQRYSFFCHQRNELKYQASMLDGSSKSPATFSAPTFNPHAFWENKNILAQKQAFTEQTHNPVNAV